VEAASEHGAAGQNESNKTNNPKGGTKQYSQEEWIMEEVEYDVQRRRWEGGGVETRGHFPGARRQWAVFLLYGTATLLLQWRWKREEEVAVARGKISLDRLFTDSFHGQAGASISRRSLMCHATSHTKWKEHLLRREVLETPLYCTSYVELAHEKISTRIGCDELAVSQTPRRRRIQDDCQNAQADRSPLCIVAQYHC
jgi:hypothetical protein